MTADDEYLHTSPMMLDIIHQGQEAIKKGLGEMIRIKDLWHIGNN